MTADWRDALASISGLAEGDDEVQAVTDGGNGSKKSVTLFYERKGRAGKPVTILGDFTGVDEAEINVLASELKRRSGSGGSARGGEILIQGDRRELIREYLKGKGFRVKG